ncbi:glycine--tRNA ligase subunit beta [Brevundimonas variabilis]|uniref:Glycine--tRNA ligase beta subunit n=1 Tax=Brevundimonas variabilis TaxID=74312 RepID=A0A7W9FGB9_9CAUL|nr:glycine--tRNA ligase subunit beta [Brevundimonas variabilis]MBB5746488.1 glycyl-tRNA synthetase beta chain [Brevundimonas variabilis]
MPQLLIELFSEEIPARMQGAAARDLERMASERLKAAGLTWDALTTYAGPRRLTLVVEGLPVATPDREEEVKGPRTSAPEQALEGFLRKTGLTKEQLTDRDGVWFAVVASQGVQTTAVVPEMVDQIVRGFPWPKSMRWGSGTLRWVRPLKRIVALFDGAVVPFDIDGIPSSDMTEGHRFMGSGQPFAVRDFADYRARLEQEFVLLDAADRRLRILEAAKAVCAERGLVLVDDDGLLEEVAGLAEWPTPILGDMDPAFLDLPPEVIRLSMKVHQKYFAVRDPARDGLAPNFVVVANVEASDGGRALAGGNSRVLSARLNDARFFWDEDRKVGFDTWLKKLEGVTFHAKLGTLADRVERIAALAREIAPLLGADPDQAERAARLAKADLASGMVGEFPELQGIMGGYYARDLAAPFPLEGGRVGDGGGGTASPVSPQDSAAGSTDDRVNAADRTQAASTPTQPSPLQGEGSALADAIRDHYKPQGPNDTVPTAPLTVAVALADKLDTLVGFFAIDERPTGSKDPFALRRAALGVIRLLIANGCRLKVSSVVRVHSAHFPRRFGESDLSQAGEEVELLLFFADRLKVLLRDQGQRHDLVDAVFALGDDDLVRIVRRVEALGTFLATDDGTNLLAGYKRASNILRAEEKKGPIPTGMVDLNRLVLPQEQALAASVQRARMDVETAVAAEDFAGAMRALAALRAPVDDFFVGVMVNSDVPEERDNRLKLLGQVRDVMGQVADFGLIAG